MDRDRGIWPSQALSDALRSIAVAGCLYLAGSMRFTFGLAHIDLFKLIVLLYLIDAVRKLPVDHVDELVRLRQRFVVALETMCLCSIITLVPVLTRLGDTIRFLAGALACLIGCGFMARLTSRLGAERLSAQWRIVGRVVFAFTVVAAAICAMYLFTHGVVATSDDRELTAFDLASLITVFLAGVIALTFYGHAYITTREWLRARDAEAAWPAADAVVVDAAG